MSASLAHAAVALVTAAVVTTSWAGGPRTRTVPADALLAGRAHGIAVSNRGTLSLAPHTTPVVDEWEGTVPTLVWDAAADPEGNLYLGTGPEGDLFRVGPSGRAARLFSAEDDPWVTAVAVEPDGGLLAATAPGGRIWRIDRRDHAELWSEIEDRYVWALAPSSDGAVFAGIGERGSVIRLAPSGRVDPFFATGQSHVTSLVAGRDGRLLAGGGQDGTVYAIDAEGHAIVLHDDSLQEVTGLASTTDGSVWAALVAPLPKRSPLPAVRLRLPDEPEPIAPGEEISDIEDDRRETLSGFIEGLQTEGEAPRPMRGKLLRIPPEGAAEEIWSSTVEAPFALLPRDDRMLFGTGEPGRLYAATADGEVSLIAEFEQSQVTGLVDHAGDTLVALSNPGAVYRLGGDARSSGSFESRPFDAGAIARWGRIRWEADGDGSIEMYTRTGNCGRPDETWSAWSPAMTEPDDRIVNPDGRYLQWRVVLSGRPAKGPRVSSVSFRFEPHNRPPLIRSARLEGRTLATSGTVRIAWSARDADGDPLEARVRYRPPGTNAWATATTSRLPEEPGGGDESGWTDDTWSWDTKGVPEGEYELQVVVSDRSWNAPEEGGEAIARLPSKLVVDRTPPSLESKRTGPAEIEVVLADERSVIERLQLVRDGRALFAVRPVDGFADASRESFRVPLPDEATGDQGWTLRGEDAAGNTVERPLPP